MKITESTALVTGGASGLGLATVRKLQADGASVVILDLPGSNGTTIAKELGARAAFSPGDVTSPADVEAALDVASAQAGGTPRILVNSALAAHIVENPMLNGETIRLDGAIRMGPR